MEGAVTKCALRQAVIRGPLYSVEVTERMVPDEAAFVRDCAAMKQMLSDKWMPAILVALLNGSLRYTELYSRLCSGASSIQASSSGAGIQQSMLTRSLKKATAQGLVIRRPEARVFPPVVRYELSLAARDMVAAMMPLVEWVRHHRVEKGNAFTV